MVSFHVSLILDITHACHLLYIQIARQSFLLADQERRTGGGGRRNTAPSATVTSGSGTELAISDTSGPTYSQESDTDLASARRAGNNNEEELKNKVLAFPDDVVNVPRAAPPGVNFDSEYSNVTSPGLTMLDKDPKLKQLRLVNNYQFSSQLCIF